MQHPSLSPQALEQEVRDFHALFVAWIRGAHEDPEQVLREQWRSRCHPQMTFVMPGGLVLDLAELWPIFSESLGTNPHFATDVRNFRVLRTDETSALVLFEEWHRGSVNAPLPNNGRMSTALFTIEDSPRLQWRHLHQTWLPKELVAEEPFVF